jgi:hypothetical protein
MMTWVWVALGVLVVLASGWWLTWTASRLDRLHARVEGARAALDAQLVRRASTTLEVATSGLLDPASAVLLAAAAQDARDLTKALHAALTEETVAALAADPVGAVMLGELSSAAHRVALSRRFHNDAVRAVRVVRGTRTVRWLRLAGHAPMPPSFEMDDSTPDPLVR